MDIYHYFGNDISTSATGDLLTIDGLTESQQRILRRLLTPPGSYIYHPTYGAGLPAYVGTTVTAGQMMRIKGLVASQIQLETSVAKTPAPTIQLKSNPDGTFYCAISYTDQSTQSAQFLGFTVSN